MKMEANTNSKQGRTRPTAIRRIVTSHRSFSRHFQASTGLASTPCQRSSSLFESPSKLYRLNCRQATALRCLEQAKRKRAGADRDPTAE